MTIINLFYIKELKTLKLRRGISDPINNPKFLMVISVLGPKFIIEYETPKISISQTV